MGSKFAQMLVNEGGDEPLADINQARVAIVRVYDTLILADDRLFHGGECGSTLHELPSRSAEGRQTARCDLADASA